MSVDVGHLVRARLVGGRYHAWQDWLAQPQPPDVVTVAHCRACHRQHITVVMGAYPPEVPVYWLDLPMWEATGEQQRVAVYRLFDPDADLAATVAEQQLTAMIEHGRAHAACRSTPVPVAG